MTTTPRDRIDRHFERIASGDLDAEVADRLHRFAAVLDTSDPATATNRDGEPFDCKPNTVELYLRNMRLIAESGIDLTDTSASELNDYLAEKVEGPNGVSNNTIIGYQAAIRAFYAAFDLGVDPNDIDTFSPDRTTGHDEQDLFTEEEVFAMRKAVGRSRMPTRNRAFLELLIFSLQRLTALLTLRLGDVAIEEGAIYLNADYDREQGGLKGALSRGRRRPIYGATKYVRDWVRAHPSDDDSAWLFVGEANHAFTDPDSHWSEQGARDVLRRVAEWADIDKPVNPHNFRHYGITVLRRDYDCSWDEINAQAGVVKGSTMPRTTYNHIDDGDLMQNIEEAMGLAEGEQNRFNPGICPTCAEVLKSDWRKCPACDESFAPGDDDGSVEVEWLADRAAVSADSFKRIVGRAVEKELADSHDDPS